MPIGLALGLFASLLWGFVDISSAVAGRVLGSLRVLVGAQVVSIIALGLFVLAAPDTLGPSPLDGIVAGLPLGLLSAAAYLAYFTALRIGPLSVVSPVIVAYGGLTVVLAVLFRGETLLPMQAGGAVLAGAGVILTGVVFHGGSIRGARLVGPGVIAALLTVVLFAVVSVLLATPIRTYGWLPVVIGSRLSNLTASTLLLVFVLRSRLPFFGPLLHPQGRVTRSALAMVLVAGAGDVGGFGFWAIGLGVAPVWLVGLAGSFGPVMAILYAVGWLGERLRPTQWLGLAILGIGVLVLAVAG